MPNAYVLNQFPNSYGAALSLMVEMLVSAGWAFRGSGDGSGNFSTTGKVFTNTGSGPLGWHNANSWARIQDPDGVREFVFQMASSVSGGSESNIKFRYSPAAKFVNTFGGTVTATRAPTALDESYFAGLANQDYAPPGTGWIGRSVKTSSLLCMGAASSKPPYGWWFGMQDFPRGILRGGIMYDPVISVPEDPDPYVLHIGSINIFQGTQNGLGKDGSASSVWNPSVAPLTKEGCWAFMDAAKSQLFYVQPAAYGFGISQNVNQWMVMDTGIPNNPFNGKPEALPIAYMRVAPTRIDEDSQTQNAGLKGWSTLARYTGSPRITFQDTMNNKAFIAAGSLWLPWDGVTTPANAW